MVPLRKQKNHTLTDNRNKGREEFKQCKFIYYYPRKGGYIFANIGLLACYLSVCLSVSNMTQKVITDFDELFMIARQWYSFIKL